MVATRSRPRAAHDAVDEAEPMPLCRRRQRSRHRRPMQFHPCWQRCAEVQLQQWAASEPGPEVQVRTWVAVSVLTVLSKHPSFKK